jgi:hypothetical protein
VVLPLLFRGTLLKILVGAVGFNLPLVVNNGFILHRLDASLPRIVLRLAAGGQYTSSQRDAQQARTKIPQEHGVSFRPGLDWTRKVRCTIHARRRQFAAQATGGTLATRNVEHFEGIAMGVVNPWE